MKKVLKISRNIAWLLLPLSIFIPTIALADAATSDPSTGTVVGDIVMLLLKIVIFALSALASILITKAISYFEKKTKIDVPAAAENTLLGWADAAIGFAHEKAYQLLQSEGKVLSGNDKLNIALQFVLSIAKEHNIEGIAEDKIKDYINSKLGTKRMDQEGVSPTPDPYGTLPKNPTVVAAK